MQLFPDATPNSSPAQGTGEDGTAWNRGQPSPRVTEAAGSVKTGWLWILASAAWLVVVGAGTFFLLQYSETAGVAGKAPAKIPAASRVKVAGAKPALLMFVHPQCPCSGASIGELDRLMARSSQRLEARVFFMLPEGMDESWCKGNLWQRAAAIPGVELNVDRNGVEAALYGAVTSGHSVLYAADGALLFQGGITPSRGHQGDSVGAEAILTLLQKPAATVAVAPVFGCDLCQEGGAQ